MSAYDDIVDLARRQIDELTSQFPAYVSEAKLKLDALQGQQREPLVAVAKERVSGPAAYEYARMTCSPMSLPKDFRKKLGLDSHHGLEDEFDIVLLIYPRKT